MKDVYSSQLLLFCDTFFHCMHGKLVDTRNKNELILGKKAIIATVYIKGTLMQIGKSTYMFVFIQKQYPENFAFLNPQKAFQKNAHF